MENGRLSLKYRNDLAHERETNPARAFGGLFNMFLFYQKAANLLPDSHGDFSVVLSQHI